MEPLSRHDIRVRPRRRAVAAVVGTPAMQGTTGPRVCAAINGGPRVRAAIIGGTGTKVRARGDVDVNALVKRDLSSNTISVAAGLLGLAGSIGVYSIGGNFDSNYRATDNDSGGGTTESADALEGDNERTVTGSVEGTTSGLVDGFTSANSGGLPPFRRALAAVLTDAGPVDPSPLERLRAGLAQLRPG